MARPLGITVMVGAALASIGWSLTNLPEPVVTLAYADTRQETERSAPLDVLADAGFESRTEQLAPVGPGRSPGVYRVADAPVPEPAETGTKGRKNRNRARVDRDVTPKVAPYDEDKIGQIMPGLYATTFDAEGCSYELNRVMKDREVAVIGEDYLGSGRLLVHLNEIEPDWFVSSRACGDWYAWSPLPVALTQAGNGDYWVGDLARGMWQVPGSCRWEKVVSFRGAALEDVVDYGFGPGTLEIDFQTYGLRIRGCTEPMSLDVQATRNWSADVVPSGTGAT